MDASTASEDQAKTLQQAQNEFSSKNYDTCLSLLNTIAADPKQEPSEVLANNRFVAELYRDELRSVNDVLRKFEGMVRERPFRPELAYLHYNYALLLYHKRQLKKALKVLRPLQQRLAKSLDQYDAVLSGHIFLLTLAILSETDYQQANVVLEQTRSTGAKKLIPIGGEAAHLFEEGASQWDFKDMWQLVAHRVEVLNGAPELKLTMKPDSAEYCVLRAHQHFLKHDLQMAAKELSKKFQGDAFTVSKNGECQDTVLANNMGLIHFSVRHYAMAVRFFQFALNFDQLASENALSASAVLTELSACRRPEILYNLGISMLYLERPQEAFDCLLVPLNYHHNNPRLWLRVAEACIMMHRMNIKNKSNLLTCGVVGSGMLRKFILRATKKKYKTDLSDNYAIPNPNLEFSTLCLSNALMLVKNIEAANKDLDRGVPSLPSGPMKRQMLDKLKCTVLCNLSYAHLNLGDFSTALKYGLELLEQKDSSPWFRFLANNYCTEALVMMDRAQQVFPYMNPALLKEFSAKDFEGHSSPGWQCNSFELTKAIYHYNTAVSLVMMNNLSKADVLLAKSNHPDILDHVMKLRVYLDLNFGSADLPRNLALIEDKCLK